MESHKQRATEAFFGRRHGKALRVGQVTRAQTLLPEHKLK